MNNFFRGDSSIDYYYEDPLISDEGITNLPKTVKDFISSISDTVGKFDFTKFETVKDGVIQNYLNRYVNFLSQYTVKIEFNKYTSAHFAHRPYQLAQYLYGNPRMAYIIYIFNNIGHTSELNRDFLETNGLIVLNDAGLQRLSDIMQLKERIETTEFIGAMYKEE